MNMDTRATSISHGILRLIKYIEINDTNKYVTCFLYFDLEIKLASHNKLLKKYHTREVKCYHNISKIWRTINEIICWMKNKIHNIKSILMDKIINS